MNASEIIERLGGTAAVAGFCGIQPPSVSEWKANGRIPDDKLIRLAPRIDSAGIARRWELFPSDWHLIWPELVGTDGAPAAPEDAKAEAA